MPFTLFIMEFLNHKIKTREHFLAVNISQHSVRLFLTARIFFQHPISCRTWIPSANGILAWV